MVYTPAVNVVPEVGPEVWVTVAEEQLSVAVGAVQVVPPLHPVYVPMVMFAGQFAKTGAWLSTT